MNRLTSVRIWQTIRPAAVERDVQSCLRDGRSVAFAFLMFLVPHVARGERPKWIATWTASSEAAEPDPDEALLRLDDQTVRERVRISVGGSQLRLRFSNEYGNSPLLLGRVSVGIAKSQTDLAPGSLRKVTFRGKETIAIPAGTVLLSDPITLSVTHGSELAISVYVPERVKSVTWHSLALKRTVISKHGDQTRNVSMDSGKTSSSIVFLNQVLVADQSGRRVIVAFGDSLVDGDESTPETDRAWPSDLFRRLQGQRGGSLFSVVNEGVAGNRLLNNGPLASLGVSGEARFERDALDVPGVADVVLLEGTNDIGFPGAELGDLLLASPASAPGAAEIISGYQRLIARAHSRGVRIIGCTILPTEGAGIRNYHTDAKEHIREAVNYWIRSSEAFDGVIDFDAVMRDPEHPARLIPSLASGDHLHPSDAGYQKMADAIALSLFR